MKNSWRSLAPEVALIIFVTMVVYVPVFQGEFVFDDVLITSSPIVRADNGLYRIWFTREPPDYYPLTWSLWWGQWQLWGANPTGYHVVNVMLHAGGAVLVWLVLRRLNIPGAWLAALVFAVHPVNAATVAWVSEQKNTLSLLFAAATVLLYLRFDEENRYRWYGLSLATFLLSLLSKTAVVMLPVVLLGCVWWRHRKLERSDFLRSAPFFALSLILGLVTLWFQYEHTLRGIPPRADGIASRLAIAGWVPWFYLYNTIVPIQLTVIYPKWDVAAVRWLDFVPGVALVACFAMFWWKRESWGRPLLFGFGYFVVMLFPVLGFFDQGFYRHSYVADHWQYYSIVGVSALAVAGAQAAFGAGCVPVIVSIIALFGVATWQRAGLYANNERLWRDNLAKNPGAWLPHNNLGVALRDKGEFDEAFGHFEQALRLKPDFPEAHYNLGTAYHKLGRTSEAIEHFEKALRRRPDDGEAHCNLGVVLMQAGRLSEAIEHFRQALSFWPEFPEANKSLADALAAAGHFDEAAEYYRKAIEARPEWPEARNNLGLALARQGKFEEAVDHFLKAIALEPNAPIAESNLALALMKLGRFDEALTHATRAVNLNPNDAQAHYTMAVSLEKKGQFPEAAQHYREVLRLQPDHAGARTALLKLGQ